MNIQEIYPFDSAIVGLNGTYCTVGEDSFFINSPCILTENKVLTIGLNYQLCCAPIGCCIELDEVKLLDVFYFNGSAILIVQELLSGVIYPVTQCLECDEPRHWTLVSSERGKKCQ